MNAANDIVKFLSAAADDRKGEHDYTLPELHHLVVRSVQKSMCERAFRRILTGLQIEKSDNGYYTPPDAILIIGWIKNRHKYSSYREYRSKQGRHLYTQAQEIDFNAIQL
jgi:hypothetical protein